MAIAIMGFAFPQSMQSVVEESFTDKIIHKYRDNDDLRNFIDFAQKEVSILGYLNNSLVAKFEHTLSSYCCAKWFVNSW